ncbi:MAG: HDOD domain-containing protein [Planctomycetota bacterium]
MDAVDSLVPEIHKLLASKEASLPALPKVVSELMQMLDDPAVDLREVTRVVKLDPALSAKVVGVASSALYSRSPVTDIGRAVRNLGTASLRSMAITLAASLLAKGKPHVKELRAKYWQHCLATGIGTRLLARHVGERDVEQLFLAGLLFNVGKLAVLHLLNRSDVAAPVVEEAVDRVHAEAAAFLFHRWSLPKLCVRAVRAHRWGLDGIEEGQERAVGVIVLASEAARAFGMGPPHDPPLVLAEHPAVKLIGLNEVHLTDLELELEDLVRDLETYLG